MGLEWKFYEVLDTIILQAGQQVGLKGPLQLSTVHVPHTNGCWTARDDIEALRIRRELHVRDVGTICPGSQLSDSLLRRNVPNADAALGQETDVVTTE